MPQTHTHERRQTFRIADQALVELVALDSSAPTQQLDALLPRSDGFQLLSELQQIDQQLQHQLFKLTDNSPALAAALRLINSKIERLTLHVSDTSTDTEPQPISLCTNGVSIMDVVPIEPQTYCAVRLRLLPCGYAVQSLAQVVYSQPQAGGDYRIGMVFIDPDEAGQDLIAGHILQQQALIRRNERQKHDDDLNS